ncbi:MAG: hypothetical protein N7Q72_06915, partial [Spiroplasma sp. Tabriz.8]|nr:hypothetical protein [Spiroplasma sp. Tabriz.8]
DIFKTCFRSLSFLSLFLLFLLLCLKLVSFLFFFIFLSLSLSLSLSNEYFLFMCFYRLGLFLVGACIIK